MPYGTVTTPVSTAFGVSGIEGLSVAGVVFTGASATAVLLGAGEGAGLLVGSTDFSVATIGLVTGATGGLGFTGIGMGRDSTFGAVVTRGVAGAGFSVRVGVVGAGAEGPDLMIGAD